MRIKKSTIPAILLVVTLISIFILIVFSSRNIDKFREVRKYSSYDSETFYKVFEREVNIFEIGILSGRQGGDFAYIAYPVYLQLYKKLLVFVGVNQISYQLALISNIILIVFMAILYYRALQPTKEIHLFIFAVAFLDFSLISFSLTLERELFASLFLALLGFLFYKGLDKNRWPWFWLITIFFISANIRLMIPVILLVSILIYYFILWAKKFKGLSKYFITIILLILLSIIFRNQFTRIDEYLLTGQDGVGFGALIASLPMYFRVAGYSILFFIAPIPLTSVFNHEFLFPYEYFLAFSGLTYFFFWIFIIRNYKYINIKLLFLFIMVIVAHVLLGGLLYNIRHRVDIIILLAILFLEINQVKIKVGFKVKYLLNESFKCFIISVGIIGLINLIYFGMKIYK